MKAAKWVAITLSVCVSMSGCLSLRRNVCDSAPIAPPVCAPGPTVGGPPGSPHAGSEMLTLEQCIEIARANNPSLGAAGWDVQTALAQRDNAAAERWPNVRAAGSYTTYRQNQRLVPVRKNNDPGMFSTGIVAGDIILRLPLFTGGRIRSDIAAADLLGQAAAHRFARTWEELVFNVSSTFYTILGQLPVIRSLDFSIRALQGQRKKALDMMRVGKAARVEVLRTEVRISDVEQRLVRENTILEIQRRLLTTLLGIEDGGPPIKPQGNLRTNRGVPDFHAAIAMAYAERGDYNSAKAAFHAQAAKVASARAQRWPRISLEGSYGTRNAVGITDNAAAFINRLMASNPFADKQDKSFRSAGVSPSLAVGNIGLVADFPILDGGRITAQIREQEARLASTQHNLRKLELQIRLDVETALFNVSSAQQRVQLTRKAIEQGQESFRIESEKYDLGKGSITDVLDAQSAMLDAQTNHYRALADHNIALAQLGLAIGEKR